MMSSSVNLAAFSFCRRQEKRRLNEGIEVLQVTVTTISLTLFTLARCNLLSDSYFLMPNCRRLLPSVNPSEVSKESKYPQIQPSRRKGEWKIERGRRVCSPVSESKRENVNL